MPGGSHGWRECYRHPDKPAIRDCSRCGKPICKECALESGDPRLCAPCKAAPSPGVEKPVTIAGPEPYSPPVRDARLPIFELTVSDNDQPEQPGPPVPGVKPAAPAGVEAVVHPVQTVPMREPERKAERSDTVVNGHAVQEQVSSQEVQSPSSPEKEARGISANVPKQVVSALPYALAAGLSISVFWLLLALAGRQWTQIAVLTSGIVVPWAYYKGTTARKHLGRPVWRKPPPAIWMAVPSTIIVASIIPPTEYLAYRIMRMSNTELMLSDFIQKYFDTTGWILVVAGLLLAFLIPFLLKSGEDWRKPSFIDRKKPEGP